MWIHKQDLEGNILLESGEKSGIGKERQIHTNDGTFVLWSDDKDLVSSGRLFSKVAIHLSQMFDLMHGNFRKLIDAQSHSLTKIQAHLTQKIEQIIENPILTSKFTYAERKELVSKKILENPDKAAEVFLYLNKKIFELESQMMSFQLVHLNEYTNPQFQKHNIRRLLLNIWHSFDEQFASQTIRYKFNFEDSIADVNKVRLDYKLINTAFFNFFDNCSKYVKPHTEIVFDFRVNKDHFELIIEMESLVIEQDEVPKIFQLGYRSKSCRNTKGYGIGMYVFQKALQANKMEVMIKTNSKITEEFQNSKYAINRFIIAGSID